MPSPSLAVRITSPVIVMVTTNTRPNVHSFPRNRNVTPSRSIVNRGVKRFPIAVPILLYGHWMHHDDGGHAARFVSRSALHIGCGDGLRARSGMVEPPRFFRSPGELGLHRAW